MKGLVSMPSGAFILIPGAGGSAWYWHLVAPKLQQRGHEAVPVSLPAADNTAGLSEYAAAVVRAIGNREPRRVVLVAQSLAGFTAPLVCKQAPVAYIPFVRRGAGRRPRQQLNRLTLAASPYEGK
jgi:hypothetical protein